MKQISDNGLINVLVVLFYSFLLSIYIWFLEEISLSLKIILNIIVIFQTIFAISLITQSNLEEPKL